MGGDEEMAAAAGVKGGERRVDWKLGLELAIYVSLCWTEPQNYMDGIGMIFNVMSGHRTDPWAKIVA